MNYAEQAEHERRIGDWDLVAALENNDLGDYIPRIDRILATVEGENDGSDWHWIVTFNDTAEIGYITGGCDYTGWDCQSYCDVCVTDSIEQALELANEREHEIEGSDARYDDFHRPVAKLLYEQIVNDNKPEHWRARLEREHPEFKLPYVIPPTIADGDEEGAP